MSFVIFVALLASVWAFAAILIDSRVPSLRWPAAILFCLGVILSWLLLHPFDQRLSPADDNPLAL